MNDEDDNSSAARRETKRAQFAEPARKKSRMASILIIAVLALAAGVVYLLAGGAKDKPASSTVGVAGNDVAEGSNRAATGDVTIPLAELSGGKARFFEYKASDSTSVRFFAIKSSDGVYRAALDACDVCYAGKKGYYQDGDDMVCKKCGKRFPSALVNEVTGGCNPISVPRAVEGDKLVIKAAELERRRTYF